VEQIPGVRVLVAAYGLAGDPVDVGQAVQPAAGQDEHTPAGADRLTPIEFETLLDTAHAA